MDLFYGEEVGSYGFGFLDLAPLPGCDLRLLGPLAGALHGRRRYHTYNTLAMYGQILTTIPPVILLRVFKQNMKLKRCVTEKPSAIIFEEDELTRCNNESGINLYIHDTCRGNLAQ